MSSLWQLIHPIMIISILQDKKKQERLKIPAKTWQHRFRTSLYHSSYSRWVNPNSQPQSTTNKTDRHLISEQNTAKAAHRLIKFINTPPQPDPILQNMPIMDKQDGSNKHIYSPYSNYIPLKEECLISDQIVNTFVYAKELQDQKKEAQFELMQEQLGERLITGGKRKESKKMEAGQPEDWLKMKQKYICQLDRVRALGIFMQFKKASGNPWDRMFTLYSRGQTKPVFMGRVFKSMLYLREGSKLNQQLSVSVGACQPINDKIIPQVMKTWYCSICYVYDCEKHMKEPEAARHHYQYVSHKNQKKPHEHVSALARLLEHYSLLFNASDQKMDCEEKMNYKKKTKGQQQLCSSECFLSLSPKLIKNLKMASHHLLSPWVKSLLKLGIDMFSYDPCSIHLLFQFQDQRGCPTQISCTQIYTHFVVHSDLISQIDRKMAETEETHLNSQGLSQTSLPKSASTQCLNKIKQKLGNWEESEKAMCFHNFVGIAPVDSHCTQCVCQKRGFCIASCLCTEDCELRRKGCRCKDSCSSGQCTCFQNGLECEPETCHRCFPREHEPKKNGCRNDQMMRRSHKRIVVGVSQTPGAGLGCFAQENMRKNELISIYSGQSIGGQVIQIRDSFVDGLSFYNFDSPNRMRISASIDARYMGNKARFMNHCNDGTENMLSRKQYSGGTFYIGLFASRNIKAGEELTFNYDGSGDLYLNHQHKYPFIRPPTKKRQ